MATVQQILNQNDNYSQLSIDASFTLQDILLEPRDQDLAIYNNLQQIDDFDAFFEDDQPPVQINQQPSDKNNTEKPIGSSQLINVPEKIQLREKSSAQEKNKQKQVRRWARLADLPLPTSQNIRNMVYISLKNVSQVFDIANSATKGVGVPTCISSTGSKFLAIGTSIGNIVVFQIGVKGNRNLSTPDQNKYGQVTSISVSRDNRYLVAGYQTGLVILWDLYGFKLVKTILLQKNRILKVLFCSQNYQNFISSDSQGYLYLYTIQNYLWTGVKSQLLIDKSQNIYYGLKYSKIKNGKSILALTTFNSILIVILKPNITVLGSIQRPQSINSNTIPNCQIGPSQQNILQRNNNEGIKSSQIKKQDYLCVSWGRYIYIYTLISQKNQNQKIQLDFIIEQPSGIHNMQFITNGILVTLDKRQVYRVINLLSQKQKLKDNNNIVRGGHISVSQLQAETIYQRYLKDKQGKYIKCYSNTIVSCSYNPRYKEIFLISKNAVYRGRLQKWTDYIHYLLTQLQNWQLALKLCLQLYKGKYNIFAEPFVVNKTTTGLLCDIGKIFFKQRMKDLEKKRTQQNSIKQVNTQAKQLFQITIQFFCSFGCQDFMFENIYKNLKQKYFFQYEQLFMDSLQPFIEQSLLHKIPNRDIFLHIIDIYSKKPQILNKFIIGLHEDSIYFSDIVEICTKQKLFQSLSYICSINSDFISPANKIIAHLEQFPNDTIQYSYLKDYLSKLTDLKYPNGKQVGKNKDSMLRDLSIWLGCDETLQYMVKKYPEDYFQILSKLAKRLLQNDVLNEIPIFVQQVISKLDIIRQNKLLPKFLQFAVQVGLSQKIHYSQQVLRKVLDVCVQMYDNYNSIDFNKQFKYVRLLRFIQKYLLDQHQNIKNLRDQFNIKLMPKVNIWVRIIYKMLSGIDREQILKQSPELLKNQDHGRDAAIKYLFDNSYRYKQIIDKYEDLFIQFSPEQSLIYIIQDKKSTGVKQINKYIMKIEDQKLRYAVTRKILRLYRLKNKQFLNQPMDQTTQILKQSLKILNPSFMIIADSIVETHISEEVLLFYISSICKYKKQKRVFYQLVQNQYQYRPIVNKMQNIIQKYHYRSCMGFIYQQKYKLRQAFIQYQFVYEQYFNENFKKLVSHEHCHGRFMAKIFHIMLDLCFRIKTDDQWSLLISTILRPLLKPDFTSRQQNIKIIDTIQTIYEKKSSKQHPFMQQLIDVIELTLISMSREVSIDLMAVELNKYTELLNKTFIVNCLISTLKGCQKRVQTYQISKQMMVFDFVTQFEQFFKKNKLNGSPNDQICDQCELQASSRSYNPNIQQIKFEVLKCGHGYHDKCFEKNHFKCKVCTQNAYGDVKSQKILKQEKIKLGQNIIENQQKQQEDDQKKVYQYLALEQYRRIQQQKFLNFIEQYEGYITNSKNL